MSNIIVPKFPEVYIPTWKEMEVGVGAKIGGELSWELIDTRNFSKPVVVRKGKQKNMILGAMIDWWMSRKNVTGNLLGSIGYGSSGGSGHVRYCVLGTGTTAPARSQTVLVSQIGDAKSYQTQAVSPNYADYGVYTEITYEFQEDECNGDLTEWGIKSSLNTGSLLCRELFRDENGDPVVLTKTSSQVLRMAYRLYAQRASDYSESSVVCGGTTYTCRGYMCDKHLGVLLGLRNGNSMQDDYNYTMPALWLRVTETSANVFLGTSNAASLPSDNINYGAIKSGLVTVASSLIPALSDYVPGSYERELIWSFAGNEANMNIGEATFLCHKSSVNHHTFARVTFDPPIAKDSSKKLKIGVKLAVTL